MECSPESTSVLDCVRIDFEADIVFGTYQLQPMIVFMLSLSRSTSIVESFQFLEHFRPSASWLPTVTLSLWRKSYTSWIQLCFLIITVFVAHLGPSLQLFPGEQILDLLHFSVLGPDWLKPISTALFFWHWQISPAHHKGANHGLD